MVSQLHESPFKFKNNKFKVRQIITKSIVKSAPAIRHILEKMTILLIPLPLFMLFTGTEGIIEQESPDNLASLSSVSSGFFNSIDMHSLIFAGAFGVTFIIWFLTRRMWNNLEDTSYENTEYTDEYEEFVDVELTHDKQGKTHDHK